jgi:hypothetical protein
MKKLLILLFFSVSLWLKAQDTIVLMNGRVLPVKNVTFNGYSIAYRSIEKNKLKKIDTEKVFSIEYADGTEKLVFTPNPSDSLEYTIPQMRMFIKGEQDATLYYKNNFNKGLAFAVGAGASVFAIYGLVIPPAYSTIVGAFNPKMEKMKVSDPMLLKDPDYKEGYKSKVRNRKIRNSLLSGFIGFAVGAVSLSIFTNN